MAASVGSHVAATLGWVEPHRTNVTNDAAPPAAGGMPSQTAPRESSSCKNVSPAVCVGMHSRTETAPRLQWDDPSTPIPFSPETLDLPGDQQSAILEAATWLQDQLAHGPRPAREILQAANLAGISRTTLLRAKPTIAAQSKQAALGKPWFWGVGSFAVPPLAPDTQVEGTLT